MASKTKNKKTGGKLTKKCRAKLKAYTDKLLAQGGSIYKVAKGSDVHPQTITNFLEQKSCPGLDKWDQIEKYMEENPIK